MAEIKTTEDLAWEYVSLGNGDVPNTIMEGSMEEAKRFWAAVRDFDKRLVSQNRRG